MNSICAFVPLEAFRGLFPFNMELLNGNAVSLRACGATNSDGTIIRSKEYVLFGNGLATIMLQAKSLQDVGKLGYNMTFVERKNQKGVRYWEVNIATNQNELTAWKFVVSADHDTDDYPNQRMLAAVDGKPGQYIFLHYPT